MKRELVDWIHGLIEETNEEKSRFVQDLIGLIDNELLIENTINLEIKEGNQINILELIHNLVFVDEIQGIYRLIYVSRQLLAINNEERKLIVVSLWKKLLEISLQVLGKLFKQISTRNTFESTLEIELWKETMLTLSILFALIQVLQQTINIFQENSQLKPDSSCIIETISLYFMIQQLFVSSTCSYQSIFLQYSQYEEHLLMRQQQFQQIQQSIWWKAKDLPLSYQEKHTSNLFIDLFPIDSSTIQAILLTITPFFQQTLSLFFVFCYEQEMIINQKHILPSSYFEEYLCKIMICLSKFWNEHHHNSQDIDQLFGQIMLTCFSFPWKIPSTSLENNNNNNTNTSMTYIQYYQISSGGLMAIISIAIKLIERYDDLSHYLGLWLLFQVTQHSSSANMISFAEWILPKLMITLRMVNEGLPRALTSRLIQILLSISNHSILLIQHKHMYLTYALDEISREHNYQKAFAQLIPIQMGLFCYPKTIVICHLSLITQTSLHLFNLWHLPTQKIVLRLFDYLLVLLPQDLSLYAIELFTECYRVFMFYHRKTVPDYSYATPSEIQQFLSELRLFVVQLIKSSPRTLNIWNQWYSSLQSVYLDRVFNAEEEASTTSSSSTKKLSKQKQYEKKAQEKLHKFHGQLKQSSIEFIGDNLSLFYNEINQQLLDQTTSVEIKESSSLPIDTIISQKNLSLETNPTLSTPSNTTNNPTNNSPNLNNQPHKPLIQEIFSPKNNNSLVEQQQQQQQSCSLQEDFLNLD